jgi:hypothetical protein
MSNNQDLGSTVKDILIGLTGLYLQALASLLQYVTLIVLRAMRERRTTRWLNKERKAVGHERNPSRRKTQIME